MLQGDISTTAIIALFSLTYAACIAAIIALGKHNWKKLLLLIPVLLYGASLFFPVFGQHWKGYGVLAFGWMGLIGGLVAWYANPFFVLAFIGALVDKRKVAVYAAILSSALSLDTFRVLSVGLPNNGDSLKIAKLDAGAYIWLAAMFLMLILSFFVSEKRDSTEDCGQKTNSQ